MRLLSIALAVAVLFCPRAQATAFAGVKLAFWQVDFAYYDDPETGLPLYALPPGIVLECTGGAVPGAAGCGENEGISVTSNGAPKVSVVDAHGGLSIHNNGSADYPGEFVFRTTFSSFNPGGPEIGASVDHPAHEAASFFTVVSGPGVFDLHGCNMTHGFAANTSAMGASCGVSSPDFSEGELALGPLTAGANVGAAYQIYIWVLAQGNIPTQAPEPFTFGLFLAGLIALRRFRAA